MLASSQAMAAESTLDTIVRLSANTADITVVFPSTSWGDAASNECSSANGVVALDTSTEAGKTMLSLLLAAHLAGRRVKLATYDKECLSVGGLAPKIRHVNVF